MSTFILKIDCPDRKGLVRDISEAVYHFDLNMTGNQEFVDREAGYFFMRSELVGEAPLYELEKKLAESLPEEANIKIHFKEKKRIVILATKEYHCLGDLLLRHKFNEVKAEILAVISNHNTLKSLVDQFDIPFHYLPHQNLNRQEHELRVQDIVDRYNPDYLVLAKYMRILNPGFVAHYQNKIINIHHSFLPAFMGANPYRQAFDRGVKIIGATAHFVNDALDEGPIIHQDITRITHRMTPQEMAAAGRDIETITLAKALNQVFADRVFIRGNKTVVFD
jgi:formyltetrahydrofolate deformylase